MKRFFLDSLSWRVIVCHKYNVRGADYHAPGIPSIRVVGWLSANGTQPSTK